MRCFFFIFIVLNIFIVANGKCPDGTITSIHNPTNCYTFVKEKMNWFAADQKCTNIGGSLISLHDMFENQYVSGEAGSIFTESVSSDFWIGGIYNSLSPGKWAWMDNTPFDFDDWDKGQPENTTDSICASAIMNGAKWQSGDCFIQKPFVCFVKPMSSICPEGWTYFNYTNSCYKVVVKSLNWFDAELFCVNEDSHLISIHNWREMVFATGLAASVSSNMCDWHNQTWLGSFTADNNTHWEWTDGSPFDFPNWSPGEPDGPGSQNCGNFWTGAPCNTTWSGSFFNIWCDYNMENFICKKNVTTS